MGSSQGGVSKSPASSTGQSPRLEQHGICDVAGGRQRGYGADHGSDGTAWRSLFGELRRLAGLGGLQERRVFVGGGPLQRGGQVEQRQSGRALLPLPPAARGQS